MSHLWEVVDVAKERLVGSSSCSNSASGGNGLQSTGRRAQKVVKASSTAPVITHTERPRSAHQEDDQAGSKTNSGFLSIMDTFDKALSLPNSPVTKDSPEGMQLVDNKKHDTKKAQRRHHTHHLFDGFLNSLGGGIAGSDDSPTRIKAAAAQVIKSNKAGSPLRSELSKSKDSGVYKSSVESTNQDNSNAPGPPSGVFRRWSETTSPGGKPAQHNQQQEVSHC